MKRILSRTGIVALMVIVLPLSIYAQNISEIAKSDPLIITGSIGTRNTYYHSSSGSGYASPWSNVIYANLNISLYGISMPFSFYYSNDNAQFSYPQFSFNLSPTYKEWTGHIGQSSISFSNYVMNMSFNGVGLEYNSKKMRFGAFYGTLRKAVNSDPNDPSGTATPQYKRVAWGFKAGYGSSKNYVDLYFLRAYDRASSINEYSQGLVRPQENLALGLKGAVSLQKWLSLSANLACSLFSTDTEAETISSSATKDINKIFDTRFSTLFRFAGDMNLNFSFSGFNTSLTYRMVQPDYTSLGLNYMTNNYQSFGISIGTTLFKSISLSANFSGQSDNLTDKQLYTTKGYVYSANASTSIGEKINLSLSYNGYLQDQTDGTMKINDSVRVNRMMQSFSFTPSYSTETENFSHTVSLSGSYTENKDLNKFSNGSSDVKSLAAGLSYGLGILPWELDVSASLSHQESKGYASKYSSDVLSIGLSRSFFESLSLSATFSACYNEVKYQSKSLSMAMDFSAGYTLAEVHAFSLSAGFSKYGDINITQTRSSLDATDINLSFNYVYTFSLIEIKRKAETQE